MFKKKSAVARSNDTQYFRDVYRAINEENAIIRFDLDARITDVNDNFLTTMGYDRSELIGQYHKLFVLPDYAASAEYKQLWNDLRAGKPYSDLIARFTKDGSRVWLQASYNPIRDEDGNVVAVTKIASDVTQATEDNIINNFKVDAVEQSQGVIEFDADGIVTYANDAFLSLVEYTLDEVVGKHHSMFVDKGYANSPEYSQFWKKLNAQQFQRGEFARVSKSGRDIHISAIYYPMTDAHGNVYKVVKFATDITSRKHALDAIGDAAAQVSKGCLDCEITETFEPSLEDLRRNFNTMVETLGRFVNDVKTTVDDISKEAETISAGAVDLSSRTESQASTLEETAATMEEMSTNISMTAQNAAEGTQLASTAQKQATAGQEVIDEIVGAMSAIEDVAARIAEITAVINAISFQTNLLALNAAVEAARAGDSGKGFAVVAAEVRTLAQRSSAAASDIGELISESTDKVQHGATLVRSSGATIAEIMASVHDLSRRITDISVACSDQANGVTEVSQGVSQLDSITQKNSAVAEENAATSIGLKGMSEQLQNLIGFFDVPENRSNTAETDDSTKAA